jgi:hypothetical protein
VNKSPTSAELTIMIAGGVMLVASFLHFEGNTSAWGQYLFPVATLLPLYGTVMAVQVGLTKLADVKLPPRVAGFTWEQLHLVFGALATLMAVGWLVTDGDKQIGLYLEVFGAFALLAGAVMMQRERHTGAIG